MDEKKVIERYNNKLEILKNNCLSLNDDIEFKDLFKGVMIMFIRKIIELKNKLIEKIPDLDKSDVNSKISQLNLVLDHLENDNNIINIDLCDILLRGYITYFYKDYRDYIMNWNIEQIKNINESNIKEVIIDTANKENILNETTEYLNIIPEVVFMVNNLDDTEIIKLFFLLNNLNTIIDIYLVKKSN